VAIRTCPLCLTKVPAGFVVAYSDDIECPGCKSRLEVSVGSRVLATTLGLLAGALVWRWTRASGGMLGWVLPMVYAFLAFSVVTPLFLMAAADLRLKSAEPLVEPGAAGPAHDHNVHR
jgi:hypothetical protein